MLNLCLKRGKLCLPDRRMSPFILILPVVIVFVLSRFMLLCNLKRLMLPFLHRCSLLDRHFGLDATLADLIKQLFGCRLVCERRIPDISELWICLYPCEIVGWDQIEYPSFQWILVTRRCVLLTSGSQRLGTK